MDMLASHSPLLPSSTTLTTLPPPPCSLFFILRPEFSHRPGLLHGRLLHIKVATTPKRSSKPRSPAFASQCSVAEEVQQTENHVRLATSLEKVKVFDLKGNSLPVTDLWKDRKVVVGFTRHFGCVLCMKRANLLASRKAEMDAAGVGLIIIGPGNIEQAQGFVDNTKFPGEVYADPNYSAYEVFGFVSGVDTTVTPMTGMRVISAYLEGYRQDWRLSFQNDTVSKGGWQQGGVLVAGPGKDSISFLFKDAQAGDEPKMDDVMAACCAS